MIWKVPTKQVAEEEEEKAGKEHNPNYHVTIKVMLTLADSVFTEDVDGCYAPTDPVYFYV